MGTNFTAQPSLIRRHINQKEEMLMRDIFKSEMPLARKIQLERCVQRISAISKDRGRCLQTQCAHNK